MKRTLREMNYPPAASSFSAPQSSISNGPYSTPACPNYTPRLGKKPFVSHAATYFTLLSSCYQILRSDVVYYSVSGDHYFS